MVTDGSRRSGAAAKATSFQRVTAALLVALTAAAYAQTGDDPVDLEHPAIAYRTAPRTDPVAELNSPVKQLYAVRSAVIAKHPHMEVEIGLMALDGKVMQVV